MARRAAPRPLTVGVRAACVLALAASLVTGCEMWPFGDRGRPAPGSTPQPLPSPPRQPSPTILIPPPID